MGLLALLTLSSLGCGASSASRNGTRVEGEGTESSPFLRCGRGPRTDYSFVANWQCSDGRRPLNGVEMDGARARLGSVGAGPDGHVVDLYQIPCSSGPVRIYVDAYHCSASQRRWDE